MPIKVPVYEQQVSAAGPGAGAVPDTVGSSAPPQEAFGGSIAAANSQIGAAITNAGDVLAKHTEQFMKDKADRYVVDMQERYKRDMQNRMDNPNLVDVTDKNGAVTGKRAAGYLNQNGTAADGVTSRFDQEIPSVMEKYMAEVKHSPYIAQQFYRSAASYNSAKRDEVIAHESKQTRLAYTNTLDAAIISNVDQGANISSDNPIKNRINMHRTLTELKSLNGKLSIFNNLKTVESDVAYKKLATAAIEKSVSTTALRHGTALATQQLSAFQNEIGADNYEKLLLKVNDLGEKREADVMDQVARRDASAILANSGDDFSKALTEIAAIPNPKVRAAVEKEANRLIHVKEISYNDAEAKVAGLLANDQFDAAALGTMQEKGGHPLSNQFYKIAYLSSKVTAGSGGTEKTRDANYYTMLEKWGTLNSGDIEGRPRKWMDYRNEVLTNKAMLDPLDFKKLLSLTDPNFVQKEFKPKENIFKAGLRNVMEFARKYTPIGMAATAAGTIAGGGTYGPDVVRRYVDRASAPGVKAEDVPIIQQQEITNEQAKHNPNRIKYAVGDAITKNGVTVYVVNHDEDGEPIISLKKRGA